ncbi:MAG: PilZ domain-containing protein [Halobacteria archaeon]|nr:PilZ domain-containing protein [Halobacteria archaeon]
MEPLSTPHRRRVESTYLVDLRRHPRFDTRLPARACSASGVGVDAVITNISLSGLRLEGDLQMIQTLLPGLERQDQHAPTPLQLAFVLSDDTVRPTGVTVRCQTVYARSEGDDNYQIGMMITAFDEGRDAYAEYILTRQAES